MCIRHSPSKPTKWQLADHRIEVSTWTQYDFRPE